MKITNGPTKYTDNRGTASVAPRSLVDKVFGRSQVSYSRPVPTINLTKTTSNKFKPLTKPSNGIGVGM